MPGDSSHSHARLYLLFGSASASVRILAATPSPPPLWRFAGWECCSGTLLNLKATVSSRGWCLAGLVSFCNADAAFCEDLTSWASAVEADGPRRSIHTSAGVHNVLAKFAGTRLYATSSSSSQSVAIGRGFALRRHQRCTSASQFTLTSTVTSFSLLHQRAR